MILLPSLRIFDIYYNRRNAFNTFNKFGKKEERRITKTMATNKRLLNTIQTEDKLNDVYSVDDIGPGGAYHKYVIIKKHDEISEELKTPDSDKVGEINFQKGPRTDIFSVHGAVDSDLLEIVRDRLIRFQEGEFACYENAQALYHITEALKFMNKRVMDRKAREVLGKNIE